MMKRKILISISFGLFALVGPARAQREHIESATKLAPAQVNPAERVFSGTVGRKYRIQMRLRREGRTLAGTYFYERVQKNLKLNGEIDERNNFVLREYDEGGAQTGIFKGRWNPSDCEGCGEYLTGNWSRPDGSGSLMFGLTVYAVDFRAPLKLVTRSTSETSRKPHPEYEITLEYPQIVGSSSANVERFNELIRKRATDAASADRAEFRTAADGSEFHLSYSVGLVNDDLVSVELSFYFYYGGAGQRNAFVETINYDLKRGRLIKFADLFRPGADYLKFLTDYTRRDLRRQYKDEKWMTDELVQLHVEDVVGDEDKWEITPEGLAFVFDSMEIGPAGAGAGHVIVPFAELRQIIRSEGPLAAFAR